MTNKRLRRVLVVGRGSMGMRYLRLLRTLSPDTELLSLGARAETERPKLDGVAVVPSLDDALNRGLDAAIIASPSVHHLDTALPLARRGVHLLVEKPISDSAERVPSLIAECEDNGAALLVGYNLRYSGSLRYFAKQLHDGAVGRPLSVRAEVGQYLPEWRPGDYRHSVSAQARLGGGVLLELSHEVDYLRWLFGDVDWVSAACARQSSLDIDVEDTAHLLLGFRGQQAVLANLSMDFVRRDKTRSCTVVGELGSLRWDALAATVELFSEGESEWKCLFTEQPMPDATYIAQLEHFMGCVHDGVRPEVSGEDGLSVMRVLDAARSSSRTGARVSLPRTATDTSASQAVAP